MLRAALLVCALSAAAHNSSTPSPMLLVPPPANTRRLAADLVATLRRQLMRDNYDYQAPDDDERRNTSTPSPPATAARWNADAADSSGLSADQRGPDEQHPRAELSGQLSEREEAEPYPRNKRRDADDPLHMQVAPVADPRYYQHHQHQRHQHQRAPPPAAFNSDAQESANHDDTTEHQHARRPLDTSIRRGTHNLEYSYSQQEDPEQLHDPRKEQEFAPHGHPKRPDRDYEEHGARGVRHHRYQRSSSPPRNHNIAKNDLLYYIDENQVRRNNYVSAEVSDQSAADTSAQPSPSAAAASPGPVSANTSPAGAGPNLASATAEPMRRSEATEAPAAHRARTKRPPRSIVVTVSEANVTYKLLTMRSREGRRSGPRRFVEERAADGVALISLDRGAPPAFRLPRSRRQYMHERRQRRNSHHAQQAQHTRHATR